MQLIRSATCYLFAGMTFQPSLVEAAHTQKPPLHGRHWMAITGSPNVDHPFQPIREFRNR